MINSMETRTGGYANGVANSAQYLLKTNPEGDAIDCSIERLEGESDHAYAQRIEKVFESARVHNQKNLYQFNSLALHPSEGEKFTDAQMIEMAKEVYLKNGVKNGLTENRHTMFVVERNTKHHHVHAMIHLTDLETKQVNNKMIDYNPIIQKLELKYGLYNEHRKPKEEPENKKQLKDDLKAIRDRSITPSEFLILANQSGYEIHHNGNDAYSLTKDNQTFKASDLGMSYKTLKKTLGDDPEFCNTLTRLHTDKPENAVSGSITTDEFKSVNASRKYQKYKYDGYWVAGNRFELYFAENGERAFSYIHRAGTVIFKTNDPVAIELGLTKLTENSRPCKLHVNGSDELKRNTWLEFHRMGLDKKGFTLKGYEPTPADIETLAKYKSEKHENAFDQNPHVSRPDPALQPIERKIINDKISEMLKHKEEINKNKLSSEQSAPRHKNNSGPKLKPN